MSFRKKQFENQLMEYFFGLISSDSSLNGKKSAKGRTGNQKRSNSFEHDAVASDSFELTGKESVQSMAISGFSTSCAKLGDGRTASTAMSRCV